MLIKHYFLRGKSIKETEKKLAKYYKESAVSHGMVRKWFTEFRCGRIGTSDAERLGHPKEVTSQEIIDKIHDIVVNDRRLKVHEINETVYISVGRVWHVLHECLGMRKLLQDACRVCSQPITSGLVWLRLSNVWACVRNKNKKSVKNVDWAWRICAVKAKMVPSAGKVMATIFWDSRSIILIDYLQKGKTIIEKYYASLIDRFDAILKVKRPYLVKKSAFPPRQCTIAHTSAITTAKLFDARYEILPHPAYSSDLAPSDYFLFPI